MKMTYRDLYIRNGIEILLFEAKRIKNRIFFPTQTW